MTRAGLPATTAWLGTSEVTTLPALVIARSPHLDAGHDGRPEADPHLIADRHALDPGPRLARPIPPPAPVSLMRLKVAGYDSM
jgi:hypothetical protein